MRFGGWSGKAKRVPHTLLVSAEGYEEASMTMQLEGGGKTTRAEIALIKKEEGLG